MADTRISTSELEALHRFGSPCHIYHADELIAMQLALPNLNIFHSFEVLKYINMRGSVICDLLSQVVQYLP